MIDNIRYCVYIVNMKDNDGIEQDNPELFDWKDQYEKEHKLRQEAETETILVKGIGMNSPEMKAATKKIKELENRLAEALMIDESHQKLNGKLQMKIIELEQDNLELYADNKKISRQIEDRVERARKAGM
tara:strand:+ start:615 stop:1004 length:390 start_codon:yes stop_codon:yes gene_type:complete